MHAAEQIFLLLAQGLAAILGAELERGIRLGHKAGHADGNLHALAFGVLHAVIQVHYLLGGIGNAFDVFQCFGGQAHHKVELHAVPAGLEGRLGRTVQVLLGHVLVNDKKVDIPSYLVKAGDVITIKSRSNDYLKTVMSAIDLSCAPAWITVDKDALKITFERIPQREELDPEFKEQLVIEYYSK